MPFTQETELAAKEERLAYLNAELNIDGVGSQLDAAADMADTVSLQDNSNETPDGLPAAASAKSVRPSILDGVHAYNAATKPPSAPGGNKSADREI